MSAYTKHIVWDKNLINRYDLAGPRYTSYPTAPQELSLYAELFDNRRQVKQLHWGGGTPTFISDDEMSLLMHATRRLFRLADGTEGEFSIEIHPGRVSIDTMSHLRDLGFNRISMGVQDFDPRV